MIVRVGTPTDARAAAALHARCIPEGFLGTLGAPVLTRLYRRIATSPGSFLIVGESDGCVVGFAAGTEDVSSLFRSFLLRDGLMAASLAAPRICRSIPKVWETVRHGRVEGDLPRAELLAVAVGAEVRRQGLGRSLVAATTREFRRRGIARAKVVVGAANQPALDLYGVCGFHTVTTIELHKGTISEVLVWS